MAGKIAFELASPERLLISERFDMVVIPGSDGDIGVLPGHAPLLSSLRAGVIAIHDGGAVVERVFVDGGFAEVLPERCTVLAEEAAPVADIDAGETERAIREAELDLRDAENAEARRGAESRLSRLRAMLAAASAPAAGDAG